MVSPAAAAKCTGLHTRGTAPAEIGLEQRAQRGPRSEDVERAAADEETEVLEQATDLVLKIAFDLNPVRNAALRERGNEAMQACFGPLVLAP